MDFVKPILDKLTGPDYWVALGAVIVGAVLWLRLGTTKRQDKQILRRRIIALTCVAALAIIAIVVSHSVSQRETTFTANSTGILVMRIAGDDERNALQGDIIESLNEEIRKDSGSTSIEVHAGRQIIDSSNGLADAHERARRIGQSANAKLVVWGRSSSGNRLHPRISVVPSPTKIKPGGEIKVQIVTEIDLPEENATRPLSASVRNWLFSLHSKRVDASACGFRRCAPGRCTTSSCSTR
jgi:hypothetical protein